MKHTKLFNFSNLIILFLYLSCINKAESIYPIKSINNRLIDSWNQERIFHGINVVYKGPPYHPNIDKFDIHHSLVDADMKLMNTYGINLVRLGVMWPGVQPTLNNVNYTYLDILDTIIKKLSTYDIWVILDFHQDDLSKSFCGEGIPDWSFSYIFKNKTLTYDFPRPLENPFSIINYTVCEKNYWPKYQFTYNLNSVYEELYTPNSLLQNRFIQYWKIVVSYFFKNDNNNILGYELINEPWPGDVFKNPLLLLPKYGDYHNLQPLYNKLIKTIRKIDTETPILYESITWDWTQVGFDSVLDNNSILSYHYYDPPQFSIDLLFSQRIKDLTRLNSSGILTEFELTHKKEKDLQLLNKVDYYRQSWCYWQYKDFYNITGDNNAFFNNDGSMSKDIYSLDRTYPMKVSGKIINYSFNNNTQLFNLQYIPNNSSLPSVIYLNYNRRYHNGVNVNITPNKIASYQTISNNRLLIIHNLYFINAKKNSNINIEIIPK